MDTSNLNALHALLETAQDNLDQVRQTSPPRWWQPNNWRLDAAEKIHAIAQRKYNAALLEALGEKSP